MIIQKHELATQIYRAFALVAIACIGMAMLGCIAMATVWWPRFPMDAFILPFIVGGLVGIPSIPFVVGFLLDRPLRYALPLVYGVSAVVVVLYSKFVSNHRAMWDPPIDAAVPALIAVCLLCGVAYGALPPLNRMQRGHCPDCGYNLGGLRDRGCPECGWGRKSPPGRAGG